ncbi:class II aldolase/adducin family protein [Novispirillum itersonii]|uniref:L-fuculose-phosphate aldolase n=1 Tax=Novispirillum itersonii TaxID=189 RepID=A0A7W9ZDC0_NOVIT|nr:class II aldolase/adducin family protein [Novispirillum itersonii]MBB6209423.1 L-fuculose-phosphate aldolase [Novispirillum itersonii]
MENEAHLRAEVIKTARSLTDLGLNKGTAGNVSVRCDDGFLVTPSGMPAAALAPQDIVWIGFDGRVEGTRAPSSEWRFHHDLLIGRDDLGAVIHTHAPFCTTLAVMGRGIPAFHYMIAVAGGSDIRCAPYATFGTPELSAGAVEAMHGRKACLLGQHGMIAAGETLTKALKLTVEVEELAQVYWQALQIGEPPVLPEEEMQRVLEKFKTYGTVQPAR